MKIDKYFSIGTIFAIVVGNVFGIVKGLSLMCFFFGIGELINAKQYYDKGQRKMAIIYLVVGIGVCVCGFLSLTNIL